jgi:hypothetical protein
MRTVNITLIVLALMGLAVLNATGQDEPKADGPAAAPAGAETEATGDATAEDVLNELLRRRAENPLIEPAKPDRNPGQELQPGAAQPLGTAPGVRQTKLKREGQFVITRRARMIRSTGGLSPWLLTFEADSDGLADPPMFVMPCRMLEDMEKVVGDRGDQVVFIVSGQVFVYRGANYILPTLMKLAPNMGNLNP